MGIIRRPLLLSKFPKHRSQALFDRIDRDRRTYRNTEPPTGKVQKDRKRYYQQAIASITATKDEGVV